MESNEREIDLQKEAPTLAAIGNGIPFIVPSGYFQELSDNLESLSLIEPTGVDCNSGFKVPLSYFDELSSTIESNITVEKIRSFAPSEGFALPEGYFAELSERINSRLDDSSSEANPGRRLFTSWISYAAAACITTMIATGIYFSSNTYQFDKQLSEVPDQEIMNYLQAHSTAGDTPFIIENLNTDQLEAVTGDVSSEELELYINSTTL
ncbi:hypothetical protein [Daejeonella sp.]|uniref:hypothetical protein n=1 Tax=Daejeonella sp. TaxID=2805397 RepID=UPI0039833A9C